MIADGPSDTGQPVSRPGEFDSEHGESHWQHDQRRARQKDERYAQE